MCFCLFLILFVYRLFKSEWRSDEQLSACSWHGLVNCFGAISSTAVLGTYCDLGGLLSALVVRRKMYDNKDLRPFRACFLKTQVETFDFLFLNLSCLWEGLVELLLWILRNFCKFLFVFLVVWANEWNLCKIFLSKNKNKNLSSSRFWCQTFF